MSNISELEKIATSHAVIDVCQAWKNLGNVEFQQYLLKILPWVNTGDQYQMYLELMFLSDVKEAGRIL